MFPGRAGLDCSRLTSRLSSRPEVNLRSEGWLAGGRRPGYECDRLPSFYFPHLPRQILCCGVGPPGVGGGGGGGGGGGTAVVFVFPVISPDHWLIVLLILSDYWPAAPTRGWCWVPVFSVMAVMVVTTTSRKNQYSTVGPAPRKAGSCG